MVTVQSALFTPFEPAHEIMVLFIFRKLILQMIMHSHPMGLDVWFLVGPLSTSKHYVCEQWRLYAWAFTSHLCDKYHNLISWLIWWNTEDKFLTFL